MPHNAEGVEYKTPWAVICATHGMQTLTREEYYAQMLKPNARWHCPTCYAVAEWDDDCPETNPMEE